MFKKIAAFLKKDFLIELSYKLSFLYNILGVISSVLVYFFIDKLFGQTVTAHLKIFGVNYFSYVLLSMALFSYIGVGISSFSSKIRQEQLQGTLEALFLTPNKPAVILLGMALWNFIFATLDLSVYLLLGIFLFKINFAQANLISVSVILFFSIISFSSLGILSASFILVLKRGDPVYWLLNNAEGFLGGVYFPITVMPAFLQFLAKFLPITYAIRGIQLAVYRGYPLNKLGAEIGFLTIFSLVLTPLSYLVFSYALKKIRRQGSLAQY